MKIFGLFVAVMLFGVLLVFTDAAFASFVWDLLVFPAIGFQIPFIAFIGITLIYRLFSIDIKKEEKKDENELTSALISIVVYRLITYGIFALFAHIAVWIF